jgi:hypothetical protein
MSVVTENTTTLSADAKQRSVRSLIQGAVAVVTAAVVAVLTPAIAGGIDKVDWVPVGYSAGTAALMALLAYVMAKVIPALNTSDEPAPAPAPVEDNTPAKGSDVPNPGDVL